MNDRTLETDQLAGLIGKKHDVLEQLRDLARRQGSLIQEGDMSRLMNVLAVKQNLFAQLQTLEAALNPFRDQNPDSRVWRTDDDRLRCRQVAERCETLLGEVMLIEKQCEAELVQRRDQAAAQLKETHHAAHATKAYIQNSVHTARSLDLSSES